MRPISTPMGAFAVMMLLTAAWDGRAVAQTAKRAAPTAADWAVLAKLPDFSGVWEISMGGGGRGQGRGLPQGPSLTPEAAAKRKQLQSLGREDSQTANCLPPGMPGIMGQPYPMEFLLTPGKVTIVIEAYMQVRHIYADGRPLPEDPDLTFHGTSVGRWESDTLVVDTVGFSPLTELDRNVAHSDKMRIRERFQLTGPDTMSIETTITDQGIRDRGSGIRDQGSGIGDRGSGIRDRGSGTADRRPQIRDHRPETVSQPVDRRSTRAPQHRKAVSPAGRPVA